MKYTKFLLIIAAVVITTSFSIYIGSNANSIASKSIVSMFAYSDSTQTHGDCCKTMSGCGDMKSTSDQNDTMNHEKHENKKDANEHKHGDDENDVKKDDHSGCMGH